MARIIIVRTRFACARSSERSSERKLKKNVPEVLNVQMNEIKKNRTMCGILSKFFHFLKFISFI